jgi:hypothetical protein
MHFDRRITMSATSALEVTPQTLTEATQSTTAAASAEGQAAGSAPIEQRDAANGADEGQSQLAEQNPLSSALSQREREESAARIRNLVTLPPMLRERLAELVHSSGEMADGKARVPIDDAIRVVETALPEFLRVDRAQARQPSHPTGEAFFASDPADLTEAQAEELARGQLARSGMLRGQRVRVAD